MSAELHHLPARLDRLQRMALMVGLAGLVIGSLGAFTSKTSFFNSYFYAFFFVMGLPLGGLAITMLHHLTGGDWGLAIRRECEAAALTFPLMLVFFLPIAFWGPVHLFPWADQALIAGDKILQHQAHYFNHPWFVVRAAFYFIVWITLTGLLCSESMTYEKTLNRKLVRRMRKVSAGGLVLLMVTITLASFDWVMSREAHFYSTIIGFMIAVGMTLSCLVLVVSLLRILVEEPDLKEFLNAGVLNDLGNLILTLVILWAYMSFAQFLIIWMGNISHETPWYLHRGLSMHPSPWKMLALCLLIVHFVAPFLILLSRDAKRNLPFLSTLALCLLIARSADAYWLIAPSGPETPRSHISWMDLPLLLGIFGIWFAVFVAMLRRRPLVARVEMDEEEAAEAELKAKFPQGHAHLPGHSQGHGPSHGPSHGGAPGANPAA